MHIVQISTDDSLLTQDDSDTLRRQIMYAQLLQERNKDAQLTILVLHKHGDYTPRHIGNLSIIPLHTRRILSPFAVYRALRTLPPIDVLTPQSPLEEGWGALLFAHRHNIRIVGQMHFDLFAPCVAVDRTLLHTAWNMVRMALAKQTLRFYDAWRVVAPALTQGLRRYGFNQNITTIPVAISWLDQVSPCSPKPSDAPLHVVFAGRLAPEKQLDQWLNIAQKTHATRPDVRFTIAGKGVLRDTLHTQAAQLGLLDVLHFADFFNAPPQRLIDLYQSADVFLLTSAYEGFGRVLVEAAVCGAALVSYDVTGARSLIKHNHDGLLVAQGDQDAAATAVIQLLNDPTRRHAMADAARTKMLDLYQPTALARAWVAFLCDQAA